MGIVDRLKNYYNALNRRFKLFKLKRNMIASEGNPIIFLFQTPNHTNIGDHAIAYAEIEFLSKNFSKYNVIEVRFALHKLFMKRLANYVKGSDILFIHGGGNMGNQYPHEEEVRLSVVNTFKDNLVISFPQTIYFTPDAAGVNALCKSKEVYGGHKKLFLIAREQVSFVKMKEYFPSNKVLLMPDIVLSISEINHNVNRDGILMVLRSDHERILTESQLTELDDVVKKKSRNVLYSDMHYHRTVPNDIVRAELLKFKFSQFQRAELVITDRLHGMVIAAITGTPCIAFSNYNQKVSGTYEWIKDLNYIKFIDYNYNEVFSSVKELLELKEKTLYNPTKFESLFHQIVDVVDGK